jgi:pilus assembly protein Flp/PilA
MNRLKAFRKDESGITMLEYGILAALITALSIPVIALIGPKLKTAFDTINTALP